ncbi:MAG: peptidoglycan-binding protein [Myxococcales bacterium]|nr:peptidoglycan-binding protein [Myxococcales bacterium]
MPTHVVRQGECVESIAFARGLAWETVWQHANNEGLRALRQAPTELLPGDELFVPERQPKEVACSTEARHRFRRKGVPSRIEVRFLDARGEPRTGPFELEVAGVVTTGELADGWVREWIMPDVREATVRIRPEAMTVIEPPEEDALVDEFDDRPGGGSSQEQGAPPADEAVGEPEPWEEHHVRLGHLDPIDALTGVQGRLANLGFYDGPIDGKESDLLELAIASFQDAHDLDPTGVLDDDTKAALDEATKGAG